MDLETIKNIAEIIQAIITACGIIAAGWWFFRSRNLAANLRISISVKHIIEYSGSTAAIVTIVVKNIGRTKVDKQLCVLYLRELMNDDLTSPIARRIDPEYEQSQDEPYDLFEEHNYLEPNEEITEDVTLAFGASSALRLWVVYTGPEHLVGLTRRDITWVTSAVIEKNMGPMKADTPSAGSSPD